MILWFYNSHYAKKLMLGIYSAEDHDTTEGMCQQVGNLLIILSP